MSALQAIVYGLVQGLGEFLPISSSAHLSLLPWLMGWKDPGLAFDVALHLGTLIALLAYFWRDWADMLGGALREPRGGPARMLGVIALATVPGALAGLLFSHMAEDVFRRPQLTAAMLIVFGGWLAWADRRGAKRDPISSVGLSRGLLIGLSQALAIVPGVSRSGITITAGLLEGLTPAAAARFSFLLAAPITAGAALHELHKMHLGSAGGAFYLAMFASAATGVLTIGFFLRWMGRKGLMPFVWYRLALGAAILLISASRP